MPPPRRAPQTDAICDQLKGVDPEADRARDALRVPIDAEATVDVGPSSRPGRSRAGTKAADHDLKPDAPPTPSGIFLPEHDDLWLYMARSEATSDFIVGRLGRWWEGVRPRSLGVKTPVIDLDSGPEDHGRRGRFLERVVASARKYRLVVQLAYDPPYRSKYNPIERCRGILEMPWNGSLPDSAEAVPGSARSMPWNGEHPVVGVAETTSATGVKLTPEDMRALEGEVIRLPSLEERFVKIPRKRGRPRKT